MNKRIPKILLTIVFIALLGTPLLLKKYSERNRATKSGTDPSAAIGRYGFRLEEVAKASGINFTHQAPKLDAKLGHIMPQVASVGAAVSVVDFDCDGWQDLYITDSGEGSLNSLYRNMGDGTFKDVASELGIADLNQKESGVSMGAVWGDYDNDEFEDLFVDKWGRPELFHNDAGRGFTRVTEKAGLPAWANVGTAIWFDYDRDGRLDLFVGG